jgi:adenylate cyclase
MRLARGAIVTRVVDSIGVYGREVGIAVHELVGLAGEADAERQAASWIARYEQGLDRYRGRDFPGAAIDFAEVRRERPQDRPAEVMLERCRQLQQGNAPRDWQPIAVLKSK